MGSPNLRVGQRVHEKSLFFDGTACRRGEYHGKTHDGWALVRWDGDRSVSQVSAAVLHEGNGVRHG